MRFSSRQQFRPGARAAPAVHVQSADGPSDRPGIVESRRGASRRGRSQLLDYPTRLLTLLAFPSCFSASPPAPFVRLDRASPPVNHPGICEASHNEPARGERLAARKRLRRDLTQHRSSKQTHTMPLAVNTTANGHAAGPLKPVAAQQNGTAQHIIDPVVLAKPNLALWVTKDHQ